MHSLPEPMTQQRWLRMIPVALIMYTISYIDRTNISLALDPDPRVSTMMKDLLMDNRMKGEAMGIFFIGYVLLQMLGGYLANRWSAKKFISICLLFWGACAIGCGFTRNFRQFEAARFFLGVAESGVLPATTVLLANWFPAPERARANAYWCLCQPLAVVVSAPLTGWLLGIYGWRTTLALQGVLPILWLPVWWHFINDHPHQAKWISADEREYLETTLRREIAELEPAQPISLWIRLLRWEIAVMVLIYFFHNCQAYGCMTFFTDGLKERNFTGLQHGILLAIPYALTAVIMVIVSWSSDKTGERRGHVALVYAVSGVCLITSVLLKKHFWASYVFLCFAIPGPFAAIAPFWAITGEIFPRNTMGLIIGLVNGIGNTGGFAGPYIVGSLKDLYGNISIPFHVLGVTMLLAAGLSLLLPKSSKKILPPATTVSAPKSQPAH